jgi:hypothetical protein
MLERRTFYTFIPAPRETRAARSRDRREEDRRQHHGPARILFIDLADFWARLLASMGRETA